MTKFFGRPDEGFFSNLTYAPNEADADNRTFLDRQELVIQANEKKFSKDLPTKDERMSYYNRLPKGIVPHQEMREQQEAWVK